MLQDARCWFTLCAALMSACSPSGEAEGQTPLSASRAERIIPASATATDFLVALVEPERLVAIPEQSLEYSVESLIDFDQAIHVRDLVIPDDVTLLTDPNEVVAKVLRPRIEEEPEVAAEEVPEGEERAQEEAAPEAAAAAEPSGEEEPGA